MSQFNRVGALGVGDQATGDLTAQMPGKVSAVHVIYQVVWIMAPPPAALTHEGLSRCLIIVTGAFSFLPPPLQSLTEDLLFQQDSPLHAPARAISHKCNSRPAHPALPLWPGQNKKPRQRAPGLRWIIGTKVRSWGESTSHNPV